MYDEIMEGFMSLEEARRSQRPYRYGMMLLCLGALINWLGLAENYSEPIRYAGVACILSGALLICTAMCCWLHTPIRPTPPDPPVNIEDAIHVISVNEAPPRSEKPPDYSTVVGTDIDGAMQPPSYDDAIKLNPALLPINENETYHIYGFGPAPPPPPSPLNRPSSSAEALTIENLESPASVVMTNEKRHQRPR